MTEVPRASRHEETKADEPDGGKPLEELEADLEGSDFGEDLEEQEGIDTDRGREPAHKETEGLDTDLMNEIVNEHPSGDLTPKNDHLQDKKTKAIKVIKELEMEKEQSQLESHRQSQMDIEKEWKEIEDVI